MAVNLITYTCLRWSLCTQTWCSKTVSPPGTCLTCRSSVNSVLSDWVAFTYCRENHKQVSLSFVMSYWQAAKYCLKANLIEVVNLHEKRVRWDDQKWFFGIYDAAHQKGLCECFFFFFFFLILLKTLRIKIMTCHFKVRKNSNISN